MACSDTNTASAKRRGSIKDANSELAYVRVQSSTTLAAKQT